MAANKDTNTQLRNSFFACLQRWLGCPYARIFFQKVQVEALCRRSLIDERFPVDGMLLEHEYAQTLYDNVTGISMSWSIVGDQIHMALQSPYRGWVGIGFSPNDAVTTQMLGADIWIGYV